MKRGLLISIVAAVMLCLGCPCATAQKKATVQSLTEQISALEKEISLNRELHKKNSNDRQINRSGLKLVRSELDTRWKLVKTLGEKITSLGGEIGTRNYNIRDMERRVTRLKREYADMIYAAWKNHKLNNSMAFIFDSKDFNEVTKRIDYMRRYNRMREETAVRIDSAARKLGLEVKGMERQKAELEDTKASRDKEIESLKADEAKYKKESDQLAAEEKKITGIIKQKEKAREKAKAQLQKIIQEEARKTAALKRSAEERKQLQVLSGKFDQNRGKFPFPVAGGVVIDRYGKHAHPTQKNLTVDNKGINIAAGSNAAVKCLFEGLVTRVVFINGLNNCVMVQHGEYFTVYSNLSSVQVGSGYKVATNQVIGRIPNTADSNDCFLHFEIWKNTDNLNPEEWFYRGK